METTKQPQPVDMALGKISSGLFIVSARSRSGEKQEGYLASWVQQISFSPMMVALAMKPGRPCYDLIKTGAPFCINIVGTNNGGLMKPFWSPKEGVDPFAAMGEDEKRISEKGNIVLLKAMAYLECEFSHSITPGDHELIFAEVKDGGILQPEDKPLSHVRKSGMGY